MESLLTAVKTQQDVMVDLTSQLVQRMEKLKSREFGSAEVQTAKQGILPQASSSRVNNELKPIICLKCGQEVYYQ